MRQAPARLHVLSVFPGFGVGGAQARFATIANALGAACRHSIVSLNGDLACREKLAPGLDCTFPLAGHGARASPGAVLHAMRFLRRASPDLVLTSNWGAIEWAAAAQLAGLRHVHTEDGFGPDERSVQLARRVVTRRLVLRRSAVVLPSRTLQSIATDIWRLPRRRLHHIPNGIDPGRFTDVAPERLPDGYGPVIGTVAALRPEKNVARLLRGFAAVLAQGPARLLIVGDGPERAALQRLAAELGIAHATIFAGHSAQPERWLACMDVFALSSDTEQMPISLLEAMASGLPAACTDVGDVGHMLSAENARHLSPPDDAGFAATLMAVIGADLAAIGRANREKLVRCYSQDAMVAAYSGLFGVSAA